MTSTLSSWVAALREDRQLSSALGLRWLDAEEQNATRAAWLSTWNQVPYGEAFHACCAERIARSVPLAVGPHRVRRLSKVASNLVLVFDPAEPDVPWISLSHAIPSLAWAAGGSTAEELHAALKPYLAPPRASLDLSRHERLVKQLDIEGIDVIRDSIDGMELWLDDASWGGAYLDDPWSTLPRDAGTLGLTAFLREVNDQHRGRSPSMTFRSLWSESILRIEQHAYGIWVFDVRFDPANDSRALAMLAGDEPGGRLPGDIPVDVAASLLRGASYTRESLAENLKVREAELFDVAALCALDPGEPSTISRLRGFLDAWASDPERMDGLVEVLGNFGYDSLIFEAASVARDPELKHKLLDQLTPQRPSEKAAS